MGDLSDFFKLIQEEKKKKEEEFNSLLGEDFSTENFIQDIFSTVKQEVKKEKIIKEKIEKIFDDVTLESLTNPKPKTKKTKSPKPKEEESKNPEADTRTIEKYPDVSEETPEEKPSKDSLIEKSLGLLAEPSSTKVQTDSLTPLNQKFATFDDLQKHYRTFLERIQQQLSTMGGGGEVRLEFLDDVDRDSAKRDNYFLKYDASINKWVGDDGGGVGITSIVFITGVTTYYAATRDVDYIGVSADVPVTIDLPTTAAAGKQIIVKDEGNKISTYNITVRAGIGASVENNSSVVMKINHESFTYFYNGYNWYIV